jgi:uncharacterized protein (TIRG00374 family)
MQSRVLKLFAWLAGIALLVALIVFFSPGNLWSLLGDIGATGVVFWVALTISARLIQAITTVVPLHSLGYRMRLADAFWIGWLRTFANQVVPTSGVAAYLEIVRRKTSISWSELAALASPQFVLVATALGLIGLLATLMNSAESGAAFTGLVVVYAAVLTGSIAIARGAPWFARLLPERLYSRVRKTAQALHRLAESPRVIAIVVVSHVGTILLRGARLWILFAAVGIQLDWQQALLVIAIAESTLLIQLTPGGLGIREGAVLAGAALVGIPAGIATGVAVIDRLLVIALTALITPPALFVLRRES